MIPEFVIARRRYEREVIKSETEQNLSASALKRAILKTSEAELADALYDTEFQKAHKDLDDPALVECFLDTFITDEITEKLSKQLEYVSGFEFSEDQNIFQTLAMIDGHFPFDCYVEVYPCLFEERAVKTGAYQVSFTTFGNKSLYVSAVTYLTEKGRVYVVTEYAYRFEDSLSDEDNFVYRRVEKGLEYVSFEFLKDLIALPEDLSEVWDCWSC